MKRYPEKEGINRLANILIDLGVKKYVISPGSRNAPLIKAFTAHPQAECSSVVDERSAGYFALGIALQTREPVGLICTSGTAVLNYGPALAEAYYQQIPLIAITADRPEELIDQREGQAIRQNEVYKNFTKSFCQLPQEPYDDDCLWLGDRRVSETVNTSLENPMGPVHINVPVREPLYGSTDHPGNSHKTIRLAAVSKGIDRNEAEALASAWNTYKKVMILTGVLRPDQKLDSLLRTIAEQASACVLTERTSNLFCGNYHHYIDRLLNAMPEKKADYAPDLLITIGNDVVSKQIKAFLRNNKPVEHWHIEDTNHYSDTYKSLSKLIPVQPEVLFETIRPMLEMSDSAYRELWDDLEESAEKKHKEYLEKVPWSDLKAFYILLKKTPGNSVVHLGNSTPVRYALLFEPSNKNTYYANRGISGIDGIISTASGFAFADDRINTVITGDISFFYDSNALWNKQLPANLRIIVMNNQGGNIFRIISGPDTTGIMEPYFETTQELNIKKMAAVFDLHYYYCDEQSELFNVLDELYKQHSKAVILEVKTPGKENSKVLKEYFKTLKGA